MSADANELEPQWLSLQQAARVYGVSIDTIRRHISTGELPAARFGPRLIRIRVKDLESQFRPIPVLGTWARRRPL